MCGLRFICHQMNGERHFPWRLIVLRAFSKLRKATISVVISVGLSVRPYGATRLPLDGFEYLEYSSKIFRKIQVSLKSDKNNGYFT